MPYIASIFGIKIFAIIVIAGLAAISFAMFREAQAEAWARENWNTDFENPYK